MVTGLGRWHELAPAVLQASGVWRTIQPRLLNAAAPKSQAPEGKTAVPNSLGRRHLLKRPPRQVDALASRGARERHHHRRWSSTSRHPHA